MEGSNEAPHDIENPHNPLPTSMSQEYPLRKMSQESIGWPPHNPLPTSSMSREYPLQEMSQASFGLLPHKPSPTFMSQQYPLQKMSQELPTSMSQEATSLCICKVPERLRCVNEKAYTPQVVSIGPLHHGKEGLEDMEEHKERYLECFLGRTGVSKEDYKTKIRGEEKKLRSCYAHNIGLCSEEFVRIILVDAAFIIEFLLRFFYRYMNIKRESNDFDSHITLESNDRIFDKPWLIYSIVPDMLLLENQLPFFILEDLFDADKIPVSFNTATAEVPATKLSVFDLSCVFFNEVAVLYAKDKDPKGMTGKDLKGILSSSSTVNHFVDLIRTLHLQTLGKNSEEKKPLKTRIPSMTQLHQAGVKFKVRSSKNLFDICFKNGILEIPNLIIEDNTELLLRNLIAYEQCHCSDTHYFSDYISLMDYFVNTRNDVELLLKNEIVEHRLGDHNEVSTLINSLGKGVVLNEEVFYYATLSENLNNYYKNRWNRWKANLKQEYFSTPWTIISVIAAAFIIILTIIQTVWSIAS